MIAVETFVRHNSVWTEATPTLEQVVRHVNSQQLSLGTAVASTGDSQRNALIAETAFLLASLGFDIDDYRRQEIEAKARKFLLKLPRGEAARASLTQDEWNEVALLARVTRWYTSRSPEAQFSPRIPGCGVVDSAIGDVLAGDELIEIKTVTRPFRSLDVRQALTYATMLYAADSPVSVITLLNPRRARYVAMPIGAIATMARGDSGVEMLQELMGWMIGLQTSA
jgi:hypothetical protein